MKNPCKISCSEKPKHKKKTCAEPLQGWIKGVNSETLNATRDQGKDGSLASGNLHEKIGRDVYGFTLGYYDGDYTSIGSSSFLADKTGSELLANAGNLYNGNISHMVTTITDPMNNNAMPNAFAYKYDQLNRISEAKAFDNLNSSSNTWQSGSSYNGKYNQKFTYDPNGNIMTALVKNHAGVIIDDQTYHYQTVNGKKVNNRLYAITDNATVTGGYDLLDQDAFDNNNIANNNYGYTEIGELKSDKSDEIVNIKRRVDGKITEVERASGTKNHLRFNYDANGNRIAKHVYANNWELQKSEYYVREAGGKLLTTYQYDTENLLQTERHIYGSSLLGIDKTPVDVLNATAGNLYTHKLGKKNYSLNNHLGNDLVVVTDRKVAVDDDTDGTIDFYRADIVNSRDFGPFGEYLTDRVHTPNAYPNSFNGKRDDEELFGWQDYGFRNYLKATRRLIDRVDPLFKNYPELTPYQFASNTPIQAIDQDGLEAFFIHGTLHGNEVWDKPQLKTVKDALFSLTNNKTQDASFSWKRPFVANGGNSELNKQLNTANDRRLAAGLLVDHVIQTRNTMGITDEEITLIGYSHGGNVAIQAASMLNERYGIKVNIITLNTPSYNQNHDPENPALNPGINEMIEFHSKGDWVAGGIAPGSDDYHTDTPLHHDRQVYQIEPGKKRSDSSPFNEHMLENVRSSEIQSSGAKKLSKVNSLFRNPEQNKK